MSTEDDNQAQSPFTRPGFIAAAIVMAVIVVLGAVIGVVSATRDDSSQTAPPTPAPTTSAAPTAEPSQAADGASVCGLEGEELSSTLSTAPEAQWQFQGTTAYPTSPTYGPAETDENGVRHCFQRSPEGAVFMAANAITQGSDPSVGTAWVEYVVAEGPYRDELLAGMDSSTPSEGTRLAIAGFRLLHYDGETARVDLAVRGSAEGQTVIISGVYELVWQDGDWKISADVSQPLDMGTIPDLAGYTSWGE